MKKSYGKFLLLIAIIIISCCGCGELGTILDSQVIVSDALTNTAVSDVNLLKSQSGLYTVILSDIAPADMVITTQVTIGNITAVSSGNSITITALEAGQSAVLVTVESSDFSPFHMSIPVTVELGEQNFTIEKIDQTLEKTQQDESIELTEDDVLNSPLYDGTKFILNQRLQQGETLTFSDLTEQLDMSIVDIEGISLTENISTLVQILPEQADTTIEILSGDNSTLSIHQEDDDTFSLTGLQTGTTDLIVSLTHSNYHHLEYSISVTVEPAPALLYINADELTAENGKSNQYSFITYPENSTVEIIPAEKDLPFSAQISENTLTVNGLAIGDGILDILVTAEDFGQVKYGFTTEITAVKTPASWTSTQKNGDELDVWYNNSAIITVTKNPNASLDFKYDSNMVTVENSGNQLTVTSIKEGSSNLEITVMEDGFLDNTITIPVTGAIPTANLYLSGTNVNITGNNVSYINASTTTPGASITVTSTDGISAVYGQNSVAISGNVDGTVTVTASHDNYNSNTQTINVTYQKESVNFAGTVSNVTSNGIDESSFAVVTNVSSPNITVNNSSGVDAWYSSGDGKIYYTASTSGTITIKATKDNYTESTHTVSVGYTMPAVNLSLSSSNVSITDSQEQSITVTSDSGANINISTSGDINAYYTDGKLYITANSSGTVTVTASKNGHSSTSKTITVIYTQPASSSSSSSSGNASSYANQVIAIVNEERAAVGLSPLSYDSVLSAGANVRASELVTLFSHTRPDGTTFDTAIPNSGFGYRGENVAYGQASPEAVMTGWMNSSGHKANILNSNYTHIGVGVYEYNNRLYWVQIFGG